MEKSLDQLRRTLIKTVMSNNTSKKNKELAKEALNAVRQTIGKLNSDDQRDKDQAFSSLWSVFRPQ